jgi:hypothetical protein
MFKFNEKFSTARLVWQKAEKAPDKGKQAPAKQPEAQKNLKDSRPIEQKQQSGVELLMSLTQNIDYNLMSPWEKKKAKY